MTIDAQTEARLSGKRILVTGAAGFLGRHLCRRLAAAGAETHAVSRSPRSDGEGRVRWWQADLEDLRATCALVADVKPDVLFHLSGLADGAANAGLLMPTFQSLLASTVHLIQAVNDAGRGRLILIASLEEPRTGEECVPSSPYAAAKWAASSYGRMAHQAFGTPVVIVRTYMAFGPGQEPRKVIPYTITSLLRGIPPKIHRHSRRLDWIYVDDVIDGYLRAAGEPGIEGSTIELGSGSAISIREVVERLAGMIAPGLTPTFGPTSDRTVEDIRIADTERAFSRIGWRPRTSLDTGLALTAEWFRGRQE